MSIPVLHSQWNIYSKKIFRNIKSFKGNSSKIRFTFTYKGHFDPLVFKLINTIENYFWGGRGKIAFNLLKTNSEHPFEILFHFSIFHIFISFVLHQRQCLCVYVCERERERKKRKILFYWLEIIYLIYIIGSTATL